MARLEFEDYELLESIYRTEEEVKTMLVTALERERERFFQNGLREGKQEGLREGEQKGRIEMAQLMLAKGIEMPLISEITNLPKTQLLQLREEVVVMVRKAIAFTTSKREKEQTFQNGLHEDRQKDRIEMAQLMLAKGMEMPLISEITDLPEAQLSNLTEELVFTVKVMRLSTALKRKREQAFQNGLRKGKQEGLPEGEQKGIFETAKLMLAKGMEMTLISEITNLPEAQLLQLKDGLASVKN